jgi:hypothetical protein
VRPLAPPDIESELSYAYLHAVASRSGASCVVAGRHLDNRGVDALLTLWAPFEGGGPLTEVSIHVQLKATLQHGADDGASLSYFLEEPKQYDALRSETVATQRVLVVLFLPRDQGDWLHHTPEQLILRRCAYWQSLRGAPVTTNTSGVTVKLPKAQMFTPEALRGLAARLSRFDFPRYPQP